MPDKPAPIKSGPKVTDEHLKKYEAIMGTPVGSSAPARATPPPPPTRATPPAPASKNPFASFIPKATGLGNKMFIFTGKKKIIIDGTEREEEKVKTVNPTPKKGRGGKSGLSTSTTASTSTTRHIYGYKGGKSTNIS